MNRLLISLVVMASMLLSAFGVSGAKTTSVPCGSPATKIKVLVKHIENTSAYKYTVVNNHSHEIYFLVLGDGPFMGVSFNPAHPSFNMRTPRGWRGELVWGHDHPYITFTWKLTDESMAIKPGKKLSGFELEMDVPNPIMSSLTFWAVDDANKCWWGKVESKQ